MNARWGSDAETLRGKGCADPGNRQQTDVGGVFRMCRNMLTSKSAEWSSVIPPPAMCLQFDNNCIKIPRKNSYKK